jgi:hypothetical protein
MIPAGLIPYRILTGSSLKWKRRELYINYICKYYLYELQALERWLWFSVVRNINLLQSVPNCTAIFCCYFFYIRNSDPSIVAIPQCLDFWLSLLNMRFPYGRGGHTYWTYQPYMAIFKSPWVAERRAWDGADPHAAGLCSCLTVHKSNNLVAYCIQLWHWRS